MKKSVLIKRKERLFTSMN